MRPIIRLFWIWTARQLSASGRRAVAEGFACVDKCLYKVATADLSQYDLSGGQVMRFELKPKNASVNLRLPEQLLEAVRGRAKRVGVPYQRYIRMALERALRDPK